MAHRRSAEEWARLLRELERSNQTAVAFARARGIRPDTLKWWQWRLRREAKKVPRWPTSKPVKLVAAEVVEDVEPHRDTDRPVWALTTPSGFELRVFEAGEDVLKAALLAVTGSSRR